ncbi:MAG TPA: HD domain-containing phosphohydrolase, partial [Blastocatellia bacterium]|nr:HD domain-containing phosphohydrolase [Blastocatellia bacterium]
TLSAIGLGVIGWSGWQVSSHSFHAEAITLAILSLILGRVTSTNVTGSSTMITISEAFIYLAYLLNGVENAVLVAAILTLSEAFGYARGRPLVIAWNVAATSCSVYLAGLIVAGTFGVPQFQHVRPTTFFLYVLALLSFALLQGIINIAFLLVSLALRPGKMLWLQWIKEYSWALVMSVAGILIATIVNALVYYYGFWALFSILPLLAGAHAISYPYIKNIRDANHHAEEIHAMHERTLEAFAQAIDAKKQSSAGRVARVQIYAVELGRLLNLPEPEIKALQAGALLHDIGNVAVPDYILNKPGKLSVAEREKMQLHTVVGAQILEQIQFPYPLAPIVRHHHERWDGTGYPDALAGEEIPLTARIMTLADSFEAMREDRQYRKSLTREQSLERLLQQRGKVFDPHLVDLFIAHLPHFEERVAALVQERQELPSAEETASPAIANATTEGAEEKNAQLAFLQTIHESRQHSQGNYALFEIAAQLAGVLDRQQAMTIFTSLLDSVIPFSLEHDTCVLYWLDEDHRMAPVEFAVGLQAERFLGLHIKPGEGVTGWTLANQSHFVNADPALDMFALELSRKEGAGLTDYQTVAVFPVAKNSEMLGALAVYSRTLKSFAPDHLQRLQRAVELLSNVLSSAWKYLSAQQQAFSDAVTGLPNARYLQLHFESARQRSDAHPLALLLVDLSLFRQMMEKAENKRTDQALRLIATLLKSQLRKDDLLIHYMGDQFIVLLRNVTSEIAAQISARVQSAIIEGRSFLLSIDDAVVGLSLSQVRCGEDGETLEQLLSAAQIRLQADKAARQSYEQSIAA